MPANLGQSFLSFLGSRPGRVVHRTRTSVKPARQGSFAHLSRAPILALSQHASPCAGPQLRESVACANVNKPLGRDAQRRSWRGFLVKMQSARKRFPPGPPPGDPAEDPTQAPSTLNHDSLPRPTRGKRVCLCFTKHGLAKSHHVSTYTK